MLRMLRDYNFEITIKSGAIWFTTRRPKRDFLGYAAYNNEGEHIGYVFATNDNRTTSYGYAELYFLPEFENKYGIWHRFTTHGHKLSWSRLTTFLQTNSEFKCHID